MRGEQEVSGGQASGDVPGGRLTGPEAGWQNLLRNLAAAAAVADAEAYAHGERCLTVHHEEDLADAERDQLLNVVDDAVRALPSSPAGHPFTSSGRFTRWRFRPPAAAEQLAAARAAIEHIYPGRWHIDADEH